MQGHLTSHYSLRERERQKTNTEPHEAASCEPAGQIGYTKIYDVLACLGHGVGRPFILSKLVLPNCIPKSPSRAISVGIQ